MQHLDRRWSLISYEKITTFVDDNNDNDDDVFIDCQLAQMPSYIVVPIDIYSHGAFELLFFVLTSPGRAAICWANPNWGGGSTKQAEPPHVWSVW